MRWPGPGGAELAESIRAKYHAALIDEFQDTDPVQYSIFARIYDGSSAPVAFIGDPKQAIYGFRGADVFTYMKAASRGRAAVHPHDELALGKPPDRGGECDLRSREAIPARRHSIRSRGAKPARGRHAAPHRWQRGGALLSLDVAEKDDDLPDQSPPEIVRLLDEWRDDWRPITRAGSHRRPHEHQSAGRDGAESRSARGGSRACSTAARTSSRRTKRASCATLLAAVAQPGYEKSVRAALCTDALGCTGNDLDAFTRDDAAWENELLRFQKHHARWRDEGFIQMLRHLSAEHGVRRRLLSFPDGERRLTNFLHLAELLHGACVEHRLGMNGVLKWLGQQMHGRAVRRRAKSTNCGWRATKRRSASSPCTRARDSSSTSSFALTSGGAGKCGPRFTIRARKLPAHARSRRSGASKERREEGSARGAAATVLRRPNTSEASVRRWSGGRRRRTTNRRRVIYSANAALPGDRSERGHRGRTFAGSD